MQDSIYERIHKTLTWKRIVAFNVVLFLILIVPLSVRLAQQDTENRSSAAGVEEPVVIPPVNYPTEPPRIDRVSEFYGKIGDTVVILGSNFGSYQWGSHVIIGGVDAPKDAIVRWSNTILEVKIPDGAKTGRVSVSVNDKPTAWDGNLLLYDGATAAKIALAKVSSTDGRVTVTSASGAVKGMVELAYVSEPMTVKGGPGVTITGQTMSSDSLGKKIRVMFDSVPAFSSSQAVALEYSYPGLGAVEIIRAELYDVTGKLLSVYSDPLGVKITP